MKEVRATIALLVISGVPINFRLITDVRNICNVVIIVWQLPEMYLEFCSVSAKHYQCGWYA
jgi:hypothetical protein